MMGCDSGKCFPSVTYAALMIIYGLQVLSTVERLVFDFLGYMWAPIMGNFFQLICVIIGIFGTCQYRPCVIAMYSTWNLVWLGWNVFVICLYLEVGVLNRTRELYILNIGTKNKSWWLEHGIGCHITNDTWMKTVDDESRPPEELVQGCAVDYYYVEIIHAAVQCLFSLIGFVLSCVTIYVYTEEDESSLPVNNELEFVKMRYKSPARISYRENHQYNQSLESVGPPSISSLEKPPSYDTFMKDTEVSNYASADSRSIHSKASTRSKNTKHKDFDRRHDLPWVQITPATSSCLGAPCRNYR